MKQALSGLNQNMIEKNVVFISNKRLFTVLNVKKWFFKF